MEIANHAVTVGEILDVGDIVIDGMSSAHDTGKEKATLAGRLSRRQDC